MSTYAGDREFIKSDVLISVKISSEEGLSLSTLSELFQDIESIFSVTSREVSSRVKNGRKRDGLLVVSEFKTGSLEILANPYFQGVAAGIVANVICNTFIFALRRINGRPQQSEPDIKPENSADTISDEKLREAQNKSVEGTTKQRKRIKQIRKLFKLSLTVKYNGKTYIVTGD